MAMRAPRLAPSSIVLPATSSSSILSLLRTHAGAYMPFVLGRNQVGKKMIERNELVLFREKHMVAMMLSHHQFIGFQCCFVNTKRDRCYFVEFPQLIHNKEHMSKTCKSSKKQKQGTYVKTCKSSQKLALSNNCESAGRGLFNACPP